MSRLFFSAVPEKNIVSPCGRLVARLRPSRAASWEQAYATLSLEDLPFGDRQFGWNAIWSPCSRYFAISEWRNPDASYGPDSQLVLIDVSRRRECIVERAEGGFIDPVFISDGLLKYSMITATMNERIGAYQKLCDIASWRPVSKNQTYDELPDLGANLPPSAGN